MLDGTKSYLIAVYDAIITEYNNLIASNDTTETKIDSLLNRLLSIARILKDEGEFNAIPTQPGYNPALPKGDKNLVLRSNILFAIENHLLAIQSKQNTDKIEEDINTFQQELKNSLDKIRSAQQNAGRKIISPKPSDKRVIAFGRSRIVYITSRGKQFIKHNGRFLPLLG